MFFSLRVLQYRSFFSFEWGDDAKHNQVAYNAAVSFSPRQTIAKSTYFSDHFTPIHFLIALPYKIYPHIYTWYFIMSFSYGFSSLILYLLAKDVVANQAAAFVISVSYLLYPPLHYVNLGALDTINFALPFLFLTFYFLYKKRFICYLIFMILSCMCKEDIPLVVILLGIYQLIMKYPRKWWAVTTAFSASYFILASWLASKFLRIEGLGSGGLSFDYIDLETFKQIISLVFFDTKAALKFMFSWFKVRVFIMAIYPLLFIPLFSLEACIPLFMYAQLVLSEGFLNENSYVLSPMIPFLFIALLFCLRRLSVHFGKRGVVHISLLILIACFLSNFGRNILGCVATEKGDVEHIGDNKFLNVKNMFDRRFYTIENEDKIAWKLIGMIPGNASVTASADLLPALSSRKALYAFVLNNPKAYESESFSEYPDYSADYILIHKKWLYNGLGGHYAFLTKKEDLEEEIRSLIDNYNFTLLKEEGDFILLIKVTK